MKAAWIYPFIILGGVLQSVGAPMNGQLFHSLENKWLAAAVSFLLVTFFFIAMFLMDPKPLPTLQGFAHMPRWVPIGGLVGAVQVYAGLTLVQRVGAGPFIGITVTAALIASLLIDQFGMFHMPTHPLNVWRIAGAALMVGGISLIAKF